MSSSAASFSPYQPPPDEHPGRTKVNLSAPPPPSQGSAPPPIRNSNDHQGEYYQDDDDDPLYATESYQSGTASYSHRQQQQQRYQDDTAHSIESGAAAASPFQPTYQQQQQYRGGPGGRLGAVQPDHASWATSQGVSISALCFAAWALPPFSGVAVLIMETTNDLARFHGYQSGLSGVVGILIIYILRSWFGWYTLSIIFGMGALGASWVAGSNAHRAAPTLEKVPYLPRIGPLAEEWVGTE